MEAKDLLIFSGVGLFTFLAGILLLKREIRLFKSPVTANATVVTYYDYRDSQRPRITMYTMAVEYKLKDGTIIHASEQKGSNRKKYPVGAEIEVVYSHDKPDLFTVKGDYSRKVIMVGMIILGLAMFLLGVSSAIS